MVFNFGRPKISCPLIIILYLLVAGCMKDDVWIQDHLNASGTVIPATAIYVINEGNFMYGNASISCYDTLKQNVQNDLFYKINGLPLGDVAESMTIRKNMGYIVVNNSGKIYIINSLNGKYIGKITGLTSPRFLHFVNDEKAYVTDLYASKISIVNPTTGAILSSIACPSHRSTEEMVQYGNLLFVTCWSGDHTVLIIDTDNDKILSEISTGSQPCGIVKDRFNKIWVLCQSQPGTGNSSLAQLQRIDPVSRTVDKNFNFRIGDKPVKLVLDDLGENLCYILGNSIYKLSVSDESLPPKPFISFKSQLLYGLGIDPKNGDIYVSDALDYQQSGIIYRFSRYGNLIHSFKVGIIPGRFCFN